MAFLRIAKAQGGEGIQHEYVRLVEGYGANGQRALGLQRRSERPRSALSPVAPAPSRGR